MSNRKNIFALSMLSLAVLSACGDKEETYSKEEVQKLVEEAVNEAQADNKQIVEEEVTSDLPEENVELTPATDTSSNQNPIRGAFNRYEFLPVLEEQVFTEEKGEKIYEMNSPVTHDDLEYHIYEFEIVKYLESDFTSNIFRSEEGKSYVIVFLTGQNMGDRATTIYDEHFYNKLLITDKNGQVIESYSDELNDQRVVRYYLEQYGSELDNSSKIERLGHFSYLVGYEVDDEYLQPGNQLRLSQGDTFRYSGDEYEVPFYEITSDFELPVVEDQYK